MQTMVQTLVAFTSIDLFGAVLAVGRLPRIALKTRSVATTPRTEGRRYENIKESWYV